ncbi:disease resistance protein RPV1 [Quercus suber]|uniref:disease resistance protein RPV1 n=1 Tax=Quercus suber TaxID=58331 RepID=UPI000CE1B083|nr:disease resistance protein RLM3-like [Quercus suber]POE46700.1 tmv resistance protein n [Quercus suber]
MARSSAVLAALLLSLGILVSPQLFLCVATMTHSEGQENFDPSLSTPALTHEYQVFVSFRGADLRTGFISHFFAALDHEMIGAFRDDIDLPKGGEIGPELLKAIDTSKILVVVFSKNYATSDWCLDELVKIMERKRLLNQRVLPIFYGVSQSEVLEPKGIFAEALLKGPEDKVNNWRAALKEAADLAGLQVEQYSLESEFIKEIVENIKKILNEKSAAAPSCRQIDVSGQHAVPVIPSQNDSFGHNDTSEWTPLFSNRVSLNWTNQSSLLEVQTTYQRYHPTDLIAPKMPRKFWMP